MFLAWREFKRGKGGKADIQRFEFSLEDNLFELYQELKNRIYQHSHYTAFNVCDPKLRRIHKAKVKDRVLHHAIFRILYSIFDNNFIFDAYSCRIEKGTHKAVGRLERFSSKLSRNNSRNIFALKCDIKKFFDSIDQEILLGLIKKKIIYADTIWLIEKIIISFPKGIPLGNVTSQLFANIYLNELDQFVKHNLKERCYLRYCDDFIILSESESHLHSLVVELDKFLQNELKLNLHPDKIIIRKYRQGIDFLGYVTLPHRRVLRTKTKKRIIKKMRNKKADLQDGVISEDSFKQGLQSYLGVLKHCEGHKIEKDIKNL
ncbi:MAG: RNA-directed DNA polymerase (Reverse transcriptase) [uncultured bacterium]|nr:MAG: RNA-directed DNA polymerase (Reverse transcriptase) [uncultured bacterium]